MLNGILKEKAFAVSLGSIGAGAVGIADIINTYVSIAVATAGFVLTVVLIIVNIKKLRR